MVRHFINHLDIFKNALHTCEFHSESALHTCIVRMLVCAGACVCVCVYALRIVSREKMLRFKNTFIVIIIINFTQKVPSTPVNFTQKMPSTLACPSPYTHTTHWESRR